MIRALNYNAVVINHDPFVRRVVGRLWKKRSIRSTYGDMEDALQAARLVVCRAASLYNPDGPASFETYLSTSIRKELLREARKRTLPAQTNMRLELEEDAQEAVIDTVQWAFEKLSQEDQEILAQRFGMLQWEETPAAELAELLGVGRRTAYDQVGRALGRLKQILESGM